MAVNGDTLDELDETLLRRTSPTPSTRRSPTARASGTITDDDAAPTLAIDDVTVAEGDSGTDERDLHRHALRRERPDRHGRLRDRRRHGDRARPTTRAVTGDADLRAGPDHAGRSPSP